MSSYLKEEISLSSMGLSHPEYSTFHGSQWPMPSWAYLAWRVFWFVWHLVWLVVSGVRTQDTSPSGQGAKWFVHPSNWIFLLTTVFCLLDSALALKDAWARSRSRNPNQADQERPAAPSGPEPDEILFQGEFTLVDGIKTPVTPKTVRLLWFLFEASNTCNILVTVLYWSCEHGDGDTLYADIIVFNIINCLFALTNTLVTGIPVRLLHFVYPGAFAAVYFLFNMIYFLCGGTSVTGSDVTFSPLDWNEAFPTAVTVVVGLLVVVPLAHLVFFSLFTLRLYLWETRYQDWANDPSPSSESSQPHETYRRRISLDNDRHSSSQRGQGHLEDAARDNAGFEIEENNRT